MAFRSRLREIMWRIGLSRTRTIDPVFGAVIDHGTFSSSAVQFAPVGRGIEIIIPGGSGLVQPWQRAAYEDIERQYGQLEQKLVDAAANQVSSELEAKGDALTKSSEGEHWRTEYHLDCITLPRTEGDSTQWEAMFVCATTGDDYAVRVRRWVVYEVENLGH